MDKYLEVKSLHSLKSHISMTEYLMVFLFVVCCGFTAGDLIPAKSYTIILVGFYHLVTGERRILKFPKELVVIVLAMLVVAGIHKYQSGVTDMVLLNYIPLCVAGYLLIIILGKRFPLAYLNVMYILACLSLICYSVMIISGYVPHIDALKGNRSLHQGIFLWNTRYNEVTAMRNCGPFWEPGAFAGYLILVGVLYFNDWKLLWIKHRKKVIILVLALITTFSSQGYIVAFMLILAKYLMTTNRRNVMEVYITGFIILNVISVLYISLPFLKVKIDAHIELAKHWEDDSSLLSANRFTTGMIDLTNICNNPLWGLSSDPYILYKDYSVIQWKLERSGGYGSGSGTSNYIASNGLVLYTVWLIFCYLSLRRYYASSRKSLAILLLLLALGQAEMYNTYIFYQSIPFIGLINTQLLKERNHGGHFK